MSAQQIDHYLDALEEPKRTTLAQLRQMILDILPEAEQGISYGVPAFKVRGKTIAGFAAFKNHMSYLPHSGSVFPQLTEELTGYSTSSGALRFSIDQPLPRSLVEKLIAVRLRQAFPALGIAPGPLLEAASPPASPPAGSYVPNGPANVTSRAQLGQDATGGVLGHNETLHQATRLAANVTDNYGRLRPAGTAVPIREDFNTIDNPFAWSADPAGDGWSSTAAAGLHFVAFTPASSKFHAARNAMDGVLPDGTNLRSAPYNVTDANNGLNGVIPRLPPAELPHPTAAPPLIPAHRTPLTQPKAPSGPAVHGLRTNRPAEADAVPVSHAPGRVQISC